jgi:hypothetical protein
VNTPGRGTEDHCSSMPAYGSPKRPLPPVMAGLGVWVAPGVSARRKEPYVPIILDREQRDAVRRALMINLSGVGDIHLMLMNHD